MLITPNPATPEGEAIIDLAGKLDALQARTGEWPGADTVDILGDWLSRFAFATSKALTRQVTGRAWVLRRWDRHSDEVTLWSDEASALAALAQHARSSWDNVAGTDGVPYHPPADDQTAIDLYYGPKEHRGDEDYTLSAEDIARCVHTPRRLSLADDTACAQANSAAVFHPMADPGDEGLPCIELAGILVFAYLDPDLRAVRVSVHLDTADQQLVRPDHTVPLQVEVEDATVFSTLGARPAPARVPAWKARLRRLTDRTALHAAGAQRKGG
ncbi:predicted protein [Streptomyces viridosporus ATCC 14672]|uniref:Predicted protein n=1 Tax=Streptomyces viridosporus (strain ATCC 14672 / DSM 40746 / JCM 4963 / KCTC 9882 / NRRL B-12104 / FH 1290) TaxID=566461 RepID=D5ZQF3_STRV1|nr:hypothetical protein [Streptomyces viridosporus]EFE72395.1 predicted protein [Streptomyces viridosporus ATCC 14672]